MSDEKVNVDHISAAHMIADAPKRVGMLMSNRQTSAYVRGMMDSALDHANDELAKAEPLLLGGAVVSMRWTCLFEGKYRRVSDIVTYMKPEEREHHVFITRNQFFGEIIYIGPQLPGESRQVYRARLRKGVKKLSQV